MPCYDDTKDLAFEYLKKDHQLLTRLSCAYCMLMEKHDVPIPDDVQEWWQRHKEQDARRERGELTRSEQYAGVK